MEQLEEVAAILEEAPEAANEPAAAMEAEPSEPLEMPEVGSLLKAEDRGHWYDAKVLATREGEVARRDAFMRTHGALLPRGLPALSGLLAERPLFVEVSANTQQDARLLELSTALGRVTFPQYNCMIGLRSPPPNSSLIV